MQCVSVGGGEGRGGESERTALPEELLFLVGFQQA